MKNLCTVFLLLATNAVFAQRNIDFKIDLVSLADTSMVQNNGAIKVHNVITHMGGDTLKATDTLKLSMHANGFIFPFDNGTTIDSFLYYTQKTMVKGDTLQVNFPPVIIRFPIGWYNFCFKIDVTNAGDTVNDTLQLNNTTCTQLQVVPTSVSKLNTNIQITLYPNPTNNNATISIDLEQATTLNAIVTDITGKTVLQTTPTLYTKGKNRIQLQTSNLPAGTYIVNLKDRQGAQLWSGKLIKQ